MLVFGGVVDYTTQLCGDYFINHYKNHQKTRIQWKVGVFFVFRGSLDYSQLFGIYAATNLGSLKPGHLEVWNTYRKHFEELQD